MIQSIDKRRSIRKFNDKIVSHSIIEEIIRAGTLAPSSKNRQPWKFVVVSGNSKFSMLNAMKAGLQREKYNPLLTESTKYLIGAENTLNIMQQAPIIIFVLNTLGIDINQTLTVEQRIGEICNAQSIGAAMENMTLTATELGLGSLWICDIYFAYNELNNWLNTDGELFSAMAIGYTDETPDARPRKDMHNITEWRE